MSIEIFKQQTIKDLGIAKATPTLTDEECVFFNDRILPILKKIKKRCWWSELETIFEEFEQFYKEFNNRDASIPSAPDTSKFTATVSGWIRFDKDFVVSGGYYGFNRTFTYGLKIGGNFKYGNPRFMMNYILKYINHLNLHLNDHLKRHLL